VDKNRLFKRLFAISLLTNEDEKTVVVCIAINVIGVGVPLSNLREEIELKRTLKNDQSLSF
jgi:hypothetical protein